MNKKYIQAADAAAVITAIETDDFSENTARKISLFANAFIRELEAGLGVTERPEMKDFKKLGEEIDRVGKRPSILSRGGIVCLDRQAFYAHAASAITKFSCKEDYKSVQAAQEFVEYIKREIFTEVEI